MAKPKTKWEIALPEGGTRAVEAYTKSEARAVVKKELGLKRLPPHTLIVKKEPK